MDQARELVARGFKEIVLTGVNVGDYGRKDGTNLLALLEGLMRINGLHRIRISSIEPNLLTDGIIDLAATGSPLCPHFHIPLQSGSDNILRAMRRRYHSGQYRDLITKVRERIPNCGIGVDVITGFPGESDGLFEETYRFLQELPVSYLHVFTYSERPNTPAAALDRSVEPRTRFNRNAMLRVLGKKKKDEFCRSWMGASVTVLTESTVERDHRFGLTANFIRVAIPSDAAGENELIPVRITRVNEDGCIGEVLPAGVLP
jgi:threonylcarbamoyladenosine tRNA methylthiotransferase MtaB